MVKTCRVLDEAKNSTQEVAMAKTQSSTGILSNLRKAYEEEDDPKRRDLLRALIQGEKEIAAGQGHTLTEVMADIDDFLALQPGLLDSIKEAEEDIAAQRVVDAEEVFKDD